MSRIPASLQAIFMASNKGEEVDKPPEDNSATKVFRPRRNWREQTKGWFFDPRQMCLQKSFERLSPQALCHKELKMRGYNLRHYATKRTGYHNSPTPHQLASYGSKILNLVKCNRVQEFGHMLECGLSPNACNAHGESLMHMICRHGKVDLFRVLLAYDVDLQQTDDYGRTPMHDACWASKPNFEIAKWLLEKDPALLFLFDARGSLPLTYVTKANWGMWNFFLEENMDHFFPRETAHLVSHRPPLCTVKPGTRPVPDPKDVIPASLANMVATGVMSPYELMMATQGMDSDDDTEASDSEDSDWDSDDDDSDDDDDDDDSDSETSYSEHD